MTVDPDGGDDSTVQACEIMFALLNIGCGGIDDLPELGHERHVEAVRGWYAHHGNVPRGATLEVTVPDGVVLRLACDWTGCAHPDDNPTSAIPECALPGASSWPQPPCRESGLAPKNPERPSSARTSPAAGHRRSCRGYLGGR